MNLLKMMYIKIRYIFKSFALKINIKRLIKKSVIWKSPFTINCFENIRLGTNVYIGPGAFFMAKGEIIIGNNVRIGPNCSIWTENHNFRSTTMIPYDNDDIIKPVNICENVWIGMNVSICPGVSIGEGSIIGMGAVICRDVPPGVIVVGNPGEIIGKRDMEVYERLKEEESFHKII